MASRHVRSGVGAVRGPRAGRARRGRATVLPALARLRRMEQPIRAPERRPGRPGPQDAGARDPQGRALRRHGQKAEPARTSSGRVAVTAVAATPGVSAPPGSSGHKGGRAAPPAPLPSAVAQRPCKAEDARVLPRVRRLVARVSSHRHRRIAAALNQDLGAPRPPRAQPRGPNHGGPTTGPNHGGQPRARPPDHAGSWAAAGPAYGRSARASR